MLVISRRVGERVLIGAGVVVTVLEVRGQQVRVGFEAPRSVSILRGEKTSNDRATDTGSKGVTATGAERGPLTAAAEVDDS
jgi:carbon storage regulator